MKKHKISRAEYSSDKYSLNINDIVLTIIINPCNGNIYVTAIEFYRNKINIEACELGLWRLINTEPEDIIRTLANSWGDTCSNGKDVIRKIISIGSFWLDGHCYKVRELTQAPTNTFDFDNKTFTFSHS